MIVYFALLALFGIAWCAPPPLCEQRVNCTACAEVGPGCTWCHTGVGSNTTSRCVANCTGQPGACPQFHELPCYNAVAGDVCNPPPVPEMNSAVGARHGGRVLYGQFQTLSGLRSSVPEMMCVPDARLQTLGECLCRNNSVLLQLAPCSEPNATLLLHIDSPELCARLTAYRQCMMAAIGKRCFVERYDRVCARLDHKRLAASGCAACNSLHDQTTTTFLMAHVAPECVLPNGKCTRPIYHDFIHRRKACSDDRADRSVIDDSFGFWLVTRIERGSRVLQVDVTHECLALYWASSARFVWLMHRPGALDPLAHGWHRYEHDNGARAQYIDDTRLLLQPAARAVDWAVFLDVPANATAEQVAELMQLARCRFALVLAWDGAPQSQAAFDAAMTERHQFLYDHDLTHRARSAASTPLLKATLRLFLRRNLVTKGSMPGFLLANVSSIRWNERVPFGGMWLRVFVPRALSWLGARVVISIHSDARYVEWRSSVRETWLTRARRLGFLAVFIVCNADAALIAEAELYNDIIAIEAAYVYNAERSVLPVLEHVWFQLAARHAVDALWVMKADQDTVVFPDALARFLRSQTVDPLTTYVYAGLLFEVAPVRQSTHRSYVPPSIYPQLQYPGFMSGGAGYVESIALVRCLTAHTATPLFNYFPRSDVGMRLALNEAGCAPLIIIKSAHFHADSQPSTGNQTITMHYVKDADKLRQHWAPQLARMTHD